MKGKSDDFLKTRRQDLSIQQAIRTFHVNVLCIVWHLSACRKCKTLRTVGEELVIPSATEIASIMFEDKIAS
jgi:hypothetical protein